MADNLVRIAVVGSGPAAMYAVEHLLERRGVEIEIDIFERLSTPFGLVRSGVAPDHPDKKLIVDRLFSILLDDPRVAFFGNIQIGTDIPVSQLASWYHGVIVATGASGDVHMGISGEDLEGCASARQFVSWYNGHPDFADLQFRLDTERVIIVGNGNVALDVARILVSPLSLISRTDIANHTLDALAQSRVQEVVILGRRGLLSAACNNPELEEFGHLPNVGVDLDEGHGSAVYETVLPHADWTVRRKVKLLRSLAATSRSKVAKRVNFVFHASPVELLGNKRVEAISVARSAAISTEQGEIRLLPDYSTEVIETGLVLRAIGYRGSPFPGLPFDGSRNTISNIDGRIVADDTVLTGHYVTGWIKRGCKGIIGSNKRCALQAVDAFFEDLADGLLEKVVPNRAAMLEMLNKRVDNPPVFLDGWKRIDRIERLAGRVEGRPRVKMTKTENLLACAQTASR